MSQIARPVYLGHTEEMYMYYVATLTTDVNSVSKDRSEK